MNGCTHTTPAATYSPNTATEAAAPTVWTGTIWNTHKAPKIVYDTDAPMNEADGSGVENKDPEQVPGVQEAESAATEEASGQEA